jgi:uncharacterized membrane protein
MVSHRKQARFKVLKSNNTFTSNFLSLSPFHTPIMTLIYIRIIVFCAFVGVLLSGYMTMQHFYPSNNIGEASFCDFTTLFSCSGLLKSKWAILFSVPIALLGFGWNSKFLLFDVFF